MEDEGFLYNTDGYVKEWENGKYVLLANTSDEEKLVSVASGTRAAALLYGSRTDFTYSGETVRLAPGAKVALRLYDSIPVGLYADGVMLTYLDTEEAKVKGKTTDADIYLAVYEKREDGVEELLYVEKNPTSVSLSRWKGRKIRIGVYRWDGLGPKEKAYTVSAG